MTRTSTRLVLPLVIRGRVITDDLIDHGAFLAPDLSKHVDQLVLNDPILLRDVHELSMDEIIDFLVKLGGRLDLDSNEHLQQAIDAAAEGSLYSREMLEGIYRQLPALLSRPALEEVLRVNIDRRFLEGWVDVDLTGRRVAVRAFGARAVHVVAGNSPIIALMTIINNAFARSDAIIKIPSNDPCAALSIVRTMIDLDADHPLTRHVSIGYWKGGDESIEKRLYDNHKIEKIVAWGGFASMNSIRRYLGPGLDLVALDPKLSASIIGRAAFDDPTATAQAVERAAADIGYFNQGGCVSARVLYVETGTDAEGLRQANDFGRAVMTELGSLPSWLSSPHPSFDPVLREELGGIRHSPAYKVFGGQGNEGAVVVSQDDEPVDFSDRLDCRVANIVPVDDVREALRRLTVHTQTIGIYPDSLKKAVRDECALRGGQRVISLGFATAAGMPGPHDAIQVLPRLVRWLRDDTMQGRPIDVHRPALAVQGAR